MKRGDIRVRPRPDGDGLMGSPTARGTVPGNALSSAWVYDPSWGEGSALRPVNLRALQQP